MKKRVKLNKEKAQIACTLLGKSFSDYKLQEGRYYRIRLSEEEYDKVNELYEDYIKGKNTKIDEVKIDKKDNIYELLKERYTEKELFLLSKGEGLEDKNIKYPEIHLHGRHHRIGVISDGHLGSKYSPLEWHYQAFKTFEKENCECILHCGDVVEGLTPRRISTQIYELTHIGYKAQRDLAIEVFSKSNLITYCISGNHDFYFNEFAGANIVEDICSAVPKMKYMGHDQADIDIDGITIRLFHGIDGNSYALSYRLQKLIESFTGGKKPNILLAGHVHKYCHIFERHINAVSVPTLQMQTPFMRGKKLAAHTGFIIIDFDVINGGVCNFSVKLYPFYG